MSKPNMYTFKMIDKKIITNICAKVCLYGPLVFSFLHTGFKKCSSQVQRFTVDHTETAGQFDDSTGPY